VKDWQRCALVAIKFTYVREVGTLPDDWRRSLPCRRFDPHTGPTPVDPSPRHQLSVTVFLVLDRIYLYTNKRGRIYISTGELGELGLIFLE